MTEQLHVIVIPATKGALRGHPKRKMYLGLDKDGTLSSAYSRSIMGEKFGWKFEFTEREIREINYKLLAFAVEIND